jgi:hypothetical protein
MSASFLISNPEASTAMYWPNHAASGNGAIESPFHVVHHCRAVPEQIRSVYERES